MITPLSESIRPTVHRHIPLTNLRRSLPRRITEASTALLPVAVGEIARGHERGWNASEKSLV